MISLLECIIIQGYYRPVCFRTSYREMLESHYLPSQRSKSPLWIMSPCSPSWAATWCISRVFAVAAELRSCTWQSALHTCCTPASATRARLTVFWCKSAYACICSPHTDGSARQLNFTKWSEASVSLLLLYACVWASVCRSEWLSVVELTLSLSADTWVTHVGWVAGASFVAATSCFYQKQTKLGFWKVAEASRWLFSQHSATHSIAQWCI